MSTQIDASTPPEVNGLEIRALAEALNATRGVRLYLVEREGVMQVTDELLAGETPILVCKTDPAVTDRPEVVGLKGSVKVGAGTRTDVDFFEKEQYDAMFFTEPAVEKFLLPYYHRVSDYPGLGKLLNDYNKAGVYAIAHLPKSIPTIFSTVIAIPDQAPQPFHVMGVHSQSKFVPLEQYVGMIP